MQIGYCFFGELVFHLAAEDIEQLGGDALLTQLVVLQLKLVEEFMSIVVGALHSHDSSSLLRGSIFSEDFLHERE